jgi:pyridoxine/pyridoxamine 5'-phosphate oxidase
MKLLFWKKEKKSEQPIATQEVKQDEKVMEVVTLSDGIARERKVLKKEVNEHGVTVIIFTENPI